MTQDSDDAQDMTQDIFLKVFIKLYSFQHRSSFSTWLYTISHNYCITQLKARRLSVEVITEQLREQTPQEETGDYVFEQQRRVLKKIPKFELTLLQLKYEQNRSIKEIGEHFQLSESAVKMRLTRARKRVNQLYRVHNIDEG
ncbi:hypothetical protein GCM10027592_62010 [Spirosoma flavus]